MRIEEMLLEQSFFQRDLKYGNAILALLILNKLCLLRFTIKDNFYPRVKHENISTMIKKEKVSVN